MNFINFWKILKEQKVVENREKGNKKKKEVMDKRQGEEIRVVVLKRMVSKFIIINCYLYLEEC